LATPLQIVDETITLLENINLTDCTFRANHVSNHVNLAGTLNQDRDSLIQNLKKYKNSSSFTPRMYDFL
jgi:hypothetical protein